MNFQRLLYAVCFLPLGATASENVAHQYDVSIAGIGIGDATLALDHSKERYKATLLGGFQFLFWSGNAEARSEGVKDGVDLTPQLYRSRFKSPTRVFTTEIDFGESGATRSAWQTEPPLDPEEFGERYPIQKADLIGAEDPLSSFLIPAVTGTEACSRSLKVFSGVVRFDVTLSAGEADANGVTPCLANYEPISGHRIESEEVDRLRQRGLVLSVFEISPGLWAPHVVGFQTRFGTVQLERQIVQ